MHHVTMQEVFPIQDTAERGITREQLAKLVAFISKMAGGWCETFGDHRGERLKSDTFNLYHANFWIIKPATEGYGTGGTGCSLVEIMAVHVQRPDWFVSHAWIEPRFISRLSPKPKWFDSSMFALFHFFF